MLRTVNNDLMSPSTIFNFFVCAFGSTLIEVTEIHISKMDFVAIFKDTYISATGSRREGLKIVAFYRDTHLTYTFDSDYRCIEVKINTDDEEAVNEHQNFFHNEFMPVSKYRWFYGNNRLSPNNVTVEIDMNDEASGYSITYSIWRKPLMVDNTVIVS